MATVYEDARQGFPIDDLQHPLSRRLIEDWQAAAPAGGPPGLDFIDPVGLQYMLGYLVILDVIDGRFRYRLVGTHIVQKRGVDLTGRWLDDHVDPTVAEAAGRSCRLAVETGRPVLQRFSYEAGARPHEIETLFLPVAGPGGAVARILVGQQFSADAPNVDYVSLERGPA